MRTVFVMAASLAMMLTTSVGIVRGQTNLISWSLLGSGFSTAASDNAKLASSLGQTFVGDASATNERVRSGFLVYPFRSPLSTGIRLSGDPGKPLSYSLSQNYPNPFNPKTSVKWQVASGGEAGAGSRGSGVGVKLVVYDLLGREVAVLVNERKQPGVYEVSFDATGLASGVYICRMTAGSFVQTRKMLLIR